MSRLLINENPLQVLPTLACAIGLNEAVVLQQIHYWMSSSPHFYDGRRWVYNSVASWQKQFPFWSEATIKRALVSLERQEMVSCGNYNRDPRDRSKWYSINYAALEALEQNNKPVNDAFGQFDQMEQRNMTKCNDAGCADAPGHDDPMQLVNVTKPLPENTTEITQEITTEIKNTGADADAPSPKRQKKTSFDPARLKPENVSDEVWQDWAKFRRETRKPLTETTCAYQAKQLAGHQNADEVIRRSIAGGWQGLFPERVPNQPPAPVGTKASRENTGSAWYTQSNDGSAEVFINQAAIDRLKRGANRP
ncbi:MAG: helix-turn-helix domain-containing protein [Klebsiella sp.]|uniref:helix-turn-helix domain-containing protein n=1 Tax=Klebsiella TaxID=570 RepID=UPI00277CA2CE|nr:helix-turn-helix domain-containing protein [Klebsiella sp.]MDU7530558.1 helix-turn-helix domain-containing protein [Klebsiella sp.]HDS2235907.1 helix-turn-helix domain-containing protein [Klebsiella michiganensis]HDS8617947.1 helix-turn-helix domain-containing protein [Klebsiella michiganensis]